jgi:hypothetical protein
MHRIEALFQSFDEVTFPDLFRAVGVYVIWDARQVAKPSYIGQGNILKRFASEHASRFAAPIQGYLAILGDTSRTAYKLDAVALELLLLEIAAETDRYPTVNAAPHAYGSIDKLVARHGTVRIAMSGLDPFCPPWRPRLFRPRTWITVRPDGDAIEHPWRMRRRGRPFMSL